MTTVDAAPDSEIALDRELMLFEYGTCADSVQADKLYQHHEDLKPYFKRRYLTLAFDKERKPCIRGADYVGLLPFSVEGRSHLLLVAPKGCQQNRNLGLLRFLQLLAFGYDGTLPEDLPGWEGKQGPHLFLLFLAHHYARLLGELCRREYSALTIAPKRTTYAAAFAVGSTYRLMLAARSRESRTFCRADGAKFR